MVTHCMFIYMYKTTSHPDFEVKNMRKIGLWLPKAHS